MVTSGLWLTASVVVGGIVLTAVAVAILVRVVAWRAGRTALRAQPERITLTASDGPWSSAEEPEKWRAELLARGWISAGRFVITELAGLKLAAFVLPGEGAAAAVFEHPRAGSWVDLFAESRDGRILTYTTSAKGREVESPPWKTTVRHPDAGIAELDEDFRCRMPADRVPVEVADFTLMLEAEWRRDAAWRKRHGISVREVLRATRAASRG